MNKRLFVLLASVVGLISIQARGQAPQIYISTLNGNQIQSVDPITGTATTIHLDTSGDGFNFLPEGITLGQDGKLYVANTQNNKILRMNADGSQVETIYDQSTCGESCPASPEGPVIDASGDLFFNTASGHTGVWEIAGVTSIPFGGTIPTPPTNVVTAAQTGSTFGEGLAFGGTFPPIIGRLTPPRARGLKRSGVDAALRSVFPTIGGLLASAGPFGGFLFPAPAPNLPASDPNLLIVDQSNNQILIWDGTSVATLITATASDSCSPTCIDTPIGIAVAPAANSAGNIAAGDIFVANAGVSTMNVNQFAMDGTFKGTYASNFAEPCGFEVCDTDSPIFLAIDPLGNLFVTTAQNTATGALGNVWEVTSTPDGDGYTTSQTDLTMNDSTSVYAWGITLGVITLPLNPNGGQNNYIFGPFNFKVQYAADSSFANETLTVAALPTTQAQLNLQTAGGPYSNALIVPYDGADGNGNGVTFMTTCQKNTLPPNPCDPFANSTLAFEVFTSYNTPAGGMPPSNPAFLKKADTAIYGVSPRPGDGNILDNFYIQRIDPTGSGRTCCAFSDYILVDLPPGPTTAATFSGFQPPLAPKNARVFSAGTTVAVKFTLKGLSSSFNANNVVARISVEMTTTAQGTPTANFKGIPNNFFLLRKGTFQFYLDTTGFAPGTYTLIVTSNSFAIQMVTFTIH